MAAVGVRTHTAPAKRSGSAPSTPSCSEPAMGWPPRKRGSPTASTTDAFTLPTSVTMPWPAASAARAAAATARTGVATNVTLASGSVPSASTAPIDSAVAADALVRVVPRDVPAGPAQGQADGSADQAGADHRGTPSSPCALPTRGGRRGGRPRRGGRCGGARPGPARCTGAPSPAGTAAVPQATSSSRAQIRGTSPKPALRAPRAGKVECTSSVAVNRMLTTSSWWMPLRSHSCSSSSTIRSWTCCSSSTSTVVAPRRARRTAGTAAEGYRRGRATAARSRARTSSWVEGPPLPRGQVPLGQRPDPGADEARDRVADGLAHAPHLAVPAFVDGDPQDAGRPARRPWPARWGRRPARRPRGAAAARRATARPPPRRGTPSPRRRTGG